MLLPQGSDTATLLHERTRDWVDALDSNNVPKAQEERSVKRRRKSGPEGYTQYARRSRRVLGSIAGNKQNMDPLQDPEKTPTRPTRAQRQPLRYREAPQLAFESAIQSPSRSPRRKPDVERSATAPQPFTIYEDSTADQPDLQAFDLSTTRIQLSPNKQSDDKQSSSRSSTRTSSPSKSNRSLVQLLKAANNPVVFEELEYIQSGEVPETARTLIKSLRQPYTEAVIPAALEDRIKDVAALEADFLRPSAFDRQSEVKATDIYQIWQTVDNVKLAANTAFQQDADENMWCQEVVKPLMDSVLGCYRSCMLHTTSIQTQSLTDSYLPHLDTIPLSRKSDYAWTFSHLHPTVAPFISSMGTKLMSLSPLDNRWTRQLPVLAGCEVKRVDDEIVAKGQLGILLSSILRHRRDLLREATRSIEEAAIAEAVQGKGKDKASQVEEKGKGKGKKKKMKAMDKVDGLPVQHLALTKVEELPLIGWTACGHSWNFYVAWLEDDETEQTTIIGPFVGLNTKAYLGIFGIRALLKNIEGWGRETYWPWLEVQMLKPLKELS